jgi:hypothetical protein
VGVTTETDVAPTCCSDANVAEQIDSIEDVVGWNFTDTRERLAPLLDAEEEQTPTSPRRAPGRTAPSYSCGRASCRRHCLRGSLVPVTGRFIDARKDVTMSRAQTL